MVLLFELNPSGLAQVSYNAPHLHIRLVNQDSPSRMDQTVQDNKTQPGRGGWRVMTEEYTSPWHNHGRARFAP